MSKPKSNIETVKVSITTSNRVVQFLDRLIKTEIYGRSRAEVAEQLIKRSMENYLMTDKIEKLNKEL